MANEISMEEVKQIQNLLALILSDTKRLQAVWESIKWASPDKDNREFLAMITRFQKEEIDSILEFLVGKSTT